MKTREEVEELKRQWLNDNIWDIETTEGFEEYHDELWSFRVVKEQEWERNEEIRLQKRAMSIGIDDNLLLMKYIERLEKRIDMLEEKLNKHDKTEHVTMKEIGRYVYNVTQ
jgi:hypothetical protein